MDSRDRSDIQKIATKKVACEGQQAPSGHPKIFIDLSDPGKVVACSYCGQKFIFSQ
ncbi:MAG: zinc-finger domain-containing protein [bacterium]|nr:zinc-finger domain-containing protein [bacterium]